jgi:hypothetical protein
VHTCFCTIFTLLPPFPRPSPLSSTNFTLPRPCPLLDRICFALLLSDFVEEKRKWYFCLFEIKVATQGVSLWHFHVCICNTTQFDTSPIFLHSTLVPCLWWFQSV